MRTRVHLGFAAIALGAGSLLVGCASSRGLVPQASLRQPDVLAADRSLAGVPVSEAAWPRADWWQTFGDPQLTALVAEALAGSPTLAVAAARARKALAVANVSHASLLPQAGGGASSTRAWLPESLATPPPLGGNWFTLDQLQATLSWDLDLWGKNRAAYESAVGAARAAEIDLHAARLALSTSIAQAYVQLQRDHLQLDVAQASLEEREHILALTLARNAAGLDTRVELKQAEAALHVLRVQIAQLHERIALAHDQIAALLGAGPDRGLAIARPAAQALTPVALPSTMPAELLGRRPDLVAQRWRVEAAGKDIASAKAQFYPDVNLMALAGFQSFNGASLLTAANRIEGVRAAISFPIFDGGRLRGNLAGKDADYDIAVEQYNQALADAMRDVVDQIVSLRSLAEQRGEQTAALAPLQEAYDLSLLRYREGLGNYLQVLSAEQPLLDQRSRQADLRARELELSINLIRALGGGVL
ncbi:efflux transporter outer membrane subunit [Ramlibacter sp.]|uniref:efflux transporter outer membrane subunit n=1 Tax=Ramlibacter sp. TaxID=1917967 RepID=UPI00263796C3|nr:efflux transporter outer membrane subunit [Ramlibacter sp.]MDB5955264.1 transporter [Ramlibacter sp.]